jgi:hypothetical protein
MESTDAPPTSASSRPSKAEPNRKAEICTEDEVAALVTAFYARIRDDEVLGPIFARHVRDCLAGARRGSFRPEGFRFRPGQALDPILDAPGAPPRTTYLPFRLVALMTRADEDVRSEDFHGY